MRKIVFIALLFIGLSAHGQNPFIYILHLSDKHNTPFSVSDPSQYLGPRSIERRINQGIPLDSSDLPVNPLYLDSIKSTGVEVMGASRWFNWVMIRTNDTDLVQTMETWSFINQAGRVKRIAKKQSNFNGADAREKRCRSGGPLDYGPSFNQANMIAADYLHALGFRGDSMQIAVLDAGFYRVDSLEAFDTLRTRGRILGTWDFVSNDAEVYNDHTHGMHVLSAMGGYLPGQLIGTAPEASYWLLRTEDASTETISEEYLWTLGAEFADSAGADIVNTSLGYTTFDSAAWSHSYADMDGNTTVITNAADRAAATGMLIINSAGNEGAGSWNYIGAPADGDSVLALGAVDASSAYASFSSNGPSFDGRVKPNVAAQGQGTVLAGAQGGIIYGNGTSFSGPVLTGAAACLWQASRSSGNMEIFRTIERSAHIYHAPDTLMGYGIPDFAIALNILGVPELPNLSQPFVGNPYPNPTTGIFGIPLIVANAQTIAFELFDVTGKLIVRKEVEYSHPGVCTFELTDLQKMASGIYLLNVKMDGISHSRKLLKVSGN